MDYLSISGLLIITAGWVVQYLSMKKGKKEIIKMFPTLNMLGILILIAGAFQSGALEIAIGNILTLIGAALVYLTINEK